MIRFLRNIARTLLPRAVQQQLRAMRARSSRATFFRQGTTTIRCGDHELDVPERHLLRELVKSQPERDRCIGLAARFLGRKYPGKPMIDIGANIGDTAAIIASEALNPLVLVEPSDFFLRFLRTNAGKLKREYTILPVIVSDECREVRGDLQHWGGTACLSTEESGSQKFQSLTLREIAPADTCFVKIDTDGFDFRIVQGAQDWWTQTHTAVLFEAHVDTVADLASAERCIRMLWSLGYRHWIVWDDPGHHVASLQDSESVIDLHRFLLALQNRSHRFGSARGICNLDVLALHDKDSDVFGQITAAYRDHPMAS